MIKKHYSRWVPSFTLVLFFALQLVAVAQQTAISGQVLDENGEPLPGASILIVGTTTGIVTDLDGEFSLNVDGNSEVVVVFQLRFIV